MNGQGSSRGYGRAHRRALILALVFLLGLAGCGPQAAPAAPPAPTGPENQPELISAESTVPAPEGTGSDLDALVAGNTAFAVDFYQAMRDEGDNLFFSPFSISQAMAMAYAGAREETARQMAEVLHYALPPDRLLAAFHGLLGQLSQAGAGSGEGTPAGDEPSQFELHLVNSAWAQEGYPFLEPYLELVEAYYASELRWVDFVNSYEQAREAINRWVSDETRGRIEDLLPEGSLDKLTRLVLVNAIYFKASWLTQFNANLTAPGQFTRLDGSQVEVPMMQEDLYVGYSQGDGVQAIELPYVGERASMVILLPVAGEFEGFEDGLTPAGLQELLDGLAETRLMLRMPRFKIEPPSIALKQVLAAMGIVDAFDEVKADFSGMVDPEDGLLLIDDVYHKAFVAVDEEGTEAAAATAVGFRTTSMPEQVSVDRPFVFLIRDLETGSILFMGRVLDPS